MNKETSTRGVKRTRNRRRKDGGGGDRSGDGGGRGGGDTRVRKKKSDKTTFVVPEIITKPAIETSNPFFIAVCAPDTYKPRLVSGGGGGGGGEEKEKRVNVFLRQRSRATGTHGGVGGETNYPNRFIQQLQRNSMPTVDVVEPVVAMNNEHFPSLGSGSGSGISSSTKLNFKEMVMRNTVVGTVTTTATATATATATGVTANDVKPTIIAYPRISPSLSSNNIFLAAFQSPRDDEEEASESNIDYHQQRVGFVSSTLIDSCDKKYDRLYR